MSTQTLYGTPWDDDEYVIVLDAYMRHKNRIHDPEILHELSQIIGRTPQAIAMRMENYASLDGEIHRKGLVNVSFQSRQIFEKWRDKPNELRSIAEYLVAKAKSPTQLGLFGHDRVRMPKAFDRYELYDYLGEGGFGYVYSCLDPQLAEMRALKIVRQEKLADKEIISRFTREIQALREISHQNIIKLYEDNLEIEKEFPGFVMELANWDLSNYCNEILREEEGGGGRPLLPPGKSVEIMRSIMSAVERLHRNTPQVIHRDINPSNILLTKDLRWVLADFSLVKFLRSSPSSTTFVTKTKQGWYTSDFSAPEQYRDFKRTDVRSDIYFLGVLVWELFSKAWPPFRREASGLPSPLNRLCFQATELEPDDRHTSVEAFSNEFEMVAADLFKGN